MTARRLDLRAPLVQAAAALLLMVALGCAFHAGGAFFKAEVHRGLWKEISVSGILACGMTVVIVTGGIDLAVGSLLALSSVCFALLTLPLGLAAPVAVLGCLLAGTLAGGASGALVARFRLQPFLVTLAMMVFARGLARALCGGRKVTTAWGKDGAPGSTELPPVFDLLNGTVLGGSVAVVTVLFLACAAVTGLVLARLRLGRHLYAVGGNVEAARLSGVPVQRTLVLAYAYSGLCAALAGICQAAQDTLGDPEAGRGIELDAIAMVVIGGTTLSGGRGGVGLTLIGALTIGYLQKVLSLNQYSTDARLMLTGGIILGAVLLQRRR